jgi:hypothetical protein
MGEENATLNEKQGKGKILTFYQAWGGGGILGIESQKCAQSDFHQRVD